MSDIHSQSDERVERVEQWDADRIEREIREYQRAWATIVPVTELMDTPAGHDERYDIDPYDRCDDCGDVYRITSGHRHHCNDERRYYGERDE